MNRPIFVCHDCMIVQEQHGPIPSCETTGCPNMVLFSLWPCRFEVPRESYSQLLGLALSGGEMSLLNLPGHEPECYWCSVCKRSIKDTGYSNKPYKNHSVDCPRWGWAPDRGGVIEHGVHSS